jgi:hypothetical protein
MSTLLALVKRLPAGARLDGTPDFRALTHVSVRNATSQRVQTRVIALELQSREAELSADGKTISVYGAVRFFPWPAFTIRYP